MSDRGEWAVRKKVSNVYWAPKGPIADLLLRQLLVERKSLTKRFDERVRGLSSIRGKDDFLAVMHFAEGTTTFQHAFDVASIFHSSLAVELGLFVRVTPKVRMPSPSTDRIKERPISFKRLIGLSQDKGILDEPTAQTANDVRLMRNLYVHYYNVFYLASRVSAFPEPPSAEVLAELARDERFRLAFGDIDPVEAARRLADLATRVRAVPVRDLSRELEGEMVTFYERRAREHTIKLFRTLVIEDGFSWKDIKELLATMGRIYGVYRYDPRMQDALDTLSWSCKVLDAIGTFPPHS